MREWALGVLSFAALVAACSQATTPGPNGAKDEPDDTSTTAHVAPVLTFDVVAPAGKSEFLRAYAGATDVPVRDAGASVVAGPFLSRFEAAFVAGCAAEGTLALHDGFDEAATAEPFRRAARGEIVEVGTRRVLGERFALVTFELGSVAEAAPIPSSAPSATAAPSAPSASAAASAPSAPSASAAPPSVERELFIVHGGDPRTIARLPDAAALDMPAAGLTLVKTGRDLFYLSPASKDRDGALRVEKLVAWREGTVARELAFERPLFRLSEPAGGIPSLTVARPTVTAAGLVLTTYRVELARTDASKGQPLLHDWATPRAVDLCRVAATTRDPAETVSLE